MGEGIDTVFADIGGAGCYLRGNIENLVLLGATRFGVGNDLANAITGSAQANWLLGGAGDDTLTGGAGDDVLFGEAGADVFIFARGCGRDVISDFAPGTDQFRLIGISLDDAAAVLAAATQDGDSLLIDLGQGDVVLLLGVARDAVQARDFLLA